MRAAEVVLTDESVGRDGKQPTPSRELDGTAVAKVGALLAKAIIGVEPPRVE